MIKSFKTMAIGAIMTLKSFGVQADVHKSGVEEVLVILSRI
ncbi:hypothetical protein [Marinobacter sp.]|jgi:hypothetical protein